MQFFGFLLIVSSLIHFYNFNKAIQGSDEKAKSVAWMYLASGVFVIFIGINIMRS